MSQLQITPLFVWTLHVSKIKKNMIFSGTRVGPRCLSSRSYSCAPVRTAADPGPALARRCTPTPLWVPLLRVCAGVRAARSSRSCAPVCAATDPASSVEVRKLYPLNCDLLHYDCCSPRPDRVSLHVPEPSRATGVCLISIDLCVQVSCLID